MIKFLKIVLIFYFLFFGNSYAEQIVIKNCFKPGFDAYGKKYNFKSWLKDYNAGQTDDNHILVDELVRVDTDNKMIFLTSIWKNDTKGSRKYELIESRNNIFIGKTVDAKQKNTANGFVLETQFIFVNKTNGLVQTKFSTDKNAKNYLQCSSGGNSTLRSILKMLR